MTCSNLDLTIDGALADPVIGAAMRADRVSTQHLEALLRSTARQLQAERRRTASLPAATLAGCLRKATSGAALTW